MAIVLPLLLLILFGIIDFGLVLNRQLLLTEAAREGARFAAVTGADQSAVQAKVSTILGASPSSISVTPCPADATGADDATVRLTYTYETKTPLGSMMLLFGQNDVGSFELDAQGVMACVG
jgi:Flp pilus assembly protein TadG